MRFLGRYHVPPGSSRIGNSANNCILSAALGTCVGVAIYDRKNRIGGLLHLLLDAPPNPKSVQEPEKYAATGLPIFLKKLHAAGATASLQACLAGGAIIGPLTPGKRVFDVGSRTVECVRRILGLEGIEIQQSETEGFFTSVLNLNLVTGECTIEPVMLDQTNAKYTFSPMNEDELIRSIDHLKPIPQTALKILHLITSDEVQFAEITEELKKDQVLGARTLQVCNSAQFTKPNAITSLEHALSYLGPNNLLKFVIEAAVRLFFNQVTSGYSLCKGGLYYHALGTAIIAEKIAQRIDHSDPQCAYAAGLLHDIGKIVLDQHIQDMKPMFYRELNRDDTNECLVEQEILGTDHARVGYLLANRWSFPDTLAEVIRYHHQPGRAMSDQKLVCIIFLADLLKSGLHPALELQRPSADELGVVLETLGLSDRDLPFLIDDIPLSSLTVPAATEEQPKPEP